MLLTSFHGLSQDAPVLNFGFEENLLSGNFELVGEEVKFSEGIDGKGITLEPNSGYQFLKLHDYSLNDSSSFTLQFWLRTKSKSPLVLASQKVFHGKNIKSQQNPGWVLYCSGGTLAWNVGSGERRLTYERDNDEHMPINDGRWHQITMTYDKKFSEFKLYFDARVIAMYKVHFEFKNSEPLVLGTMPADSDSKGPYSDQIMDGKGLLQNMVNKFNAIGVGKLEDDELLDLIIDPTAVLEKKIGKGKVENASEMLNETLDARRLLVDNEYTVFQNRALTELKPVSSIYSLVDDSVSINVDEGKSFTAKAALYPAEFDLDEVSIWDQPLSSSRVEDSYRRFTDSPESSFPQVSRVEELTVGVWNIWHGGIHWNLENDGWDSRKRIAEMLHTKQIDVVLMQETYSSGDFIAAELGYYFATTSDWDYRFQGANISVLSRFPIVELQVLPETEFNNVAVRLQISESQQIWAMSNWYGMQQFPSVAEFHSDRFALSDDTPVLFGGDFNAVPHTDGGDSPASVWLSEQGFTDAYRSYYPAVDKYPGYTHRSENRIDQLFFKGSGLEHQTTEVISTWPGGFPSDHYLIISKFDINN